MKSHRTQPPVSATRERSGSYAVSAEFYDILQADHDAACVRRLYGEDVEDARLGVLDVGAGTGRVTLMSLLESRVAVHAVEPASSMRAPLMTRLISLPPDMRERVTVHPQPLEETGLNGVADVAICHNVIACLPPAAREALWPAVAKALVPGGSFLVQLPPADLPQGETTHVLASQRVGEHEYGGRIVASPATDRIRTRFDYWVRTEDAVLIEDHETFWMWPAPRAEMIDDAQQYGFTPLPERPDPGVLALRRTAAASPPMP